MGSWEPEDTAPSGVPPTAQHSAIAAAMMSAFDGAIEAAGGTVGGGQPSGPDAVPVPMPASADEPDVTAGANSQGDAWPDGSWTSRLAPDSQFDEETLHHLRSLGVEVMARAALWYYWHSSCPEFIPNVWTFDHRPRSPTPPEVREDARSRCRKFVVRQAASGRALPTDHNVSRAQSLLRMAVRSTGATIVILDLSVSRDHGWLECVGGAGVPSGFVVRAWCARSFSNQRPPYLSSSAPAVFALSSRSAI